MELQLVCGGMFSSVQRVSGRQISVTSFVSLESYVRISNNVSVERTGTWEHVVSFAGTQKSNITESYQPPTHGFYVVTNQPSRGRNSEDIYLYAINSVAITSGNEVEFSKQGGLKSGIIETGEIEAMGAIWGCYLRVGLPNRFKGSRYGTYEATYTPIDGGPVLTRNTFVRPDTKFLNTRGVYTVTVYPSATGSTDLAKSDDNSIGVSWTPGCLKIRWCKGKRRNVNTGPRLTLTSTKDAGIYTIQKQQRGKRGWFVQIEVIVATCPMDQYWFINRCVARTVFPCVNGGVPQNAADGCSCPPYFGGQTCSIQIDISDEIFALGYAFTGPSAKLFCSDLVGGNNKCRGLLFCLGDLFGCKCFPGWYGNNCDRACPKGRWGVSCSLTCSDVNNCDPFVDVNTLI